VKEVDPLRVKKQEMKAKRRAVKQDKLEWKIYKRLMALKTRID
jgi:hypothetical protein